MEIEYIGFFGYVDLVSKRRELVKVPKLVRRTMIVMKYLERLEQ